MKQPFDREAEAVGINFNSEVCNLKVQSPVTAIWKCKLNEDKDMELLNNINT